MRYFLKKTAENLDWKFFQFRFFCICSRTHFEPPELTEFCNEIFGKNYSCDLTDGSVGGLVFVLLRLFFLPIRIFAARL